MMIITKDTQLKLSNLLGLNCKGNEQDWAIEFADPTRVSEFVKMAMGPELSEADRHAIVALTLSSYDELINREKINPDNLRLWQEIIDIIRYDTQLYIDLLNYWALWEVKASDNIFSITPLIRDFLHQMQH